MVVELVLFMVEVMFRLVSCDRRRVLLNAIASSKFPLFWPGEPADTNVAVVVDAAAAFVIAVAVGLAVVVGVPNATGSIPARSLLYWICAPQAAPVGALAGPVRGMTQALSAGSLAVVMGMPLASMRETVSTGADVVWGLEARVSSAEAKGEEMSVRRKPVKRDWEEKERDAMLFVAHGETVNLLRGRRIARD